MRSGTAGERNLAYLGIGFLIMATIGMFATALDPRFVVAGIPPLWIGGFFALVATIVAVRQLGAWRRGGKAGRIVDPVRARLGRRALPTVGWFAAGSIGLTLLYFGLALITPIGDADPFGFVEQVFFFASLAGGLALQTWLSRRSDKRDSESPTFGPYEPDPSMVAAVEIPAQQQRVAKVLYILALGGMLVVFVFSLLGRGGWVLLSVGSLPLVVWLTYSSIVIRARRREMEQES